MTTPHENPEWRLWVDIIDQECRRQFNTRRPKRHHPRPYIQNWAFPYHGFHITVFVEETTAFIETRNHHNHTIHQTRIPQGQDPTTHITAHKNATNTHIKENQ